MSSLLLFLLALAVPEGIASAQVRPDSTWQYSVALEAGTERRAYLWIPPRCVHVRAVMLGVQNMLERPMFEDPEIRSTLASLNMGIVWISPGAWPGKPPTAVQPSLQFSPPNDAIRGVQRALTLLAKESGYSEIASAPLLVTGHSAAMPFVWGMAAALPKRVFAALPYKGIGAGPVSHDVPTLYVDQEWAEWGRNWGSNWPRDLNTSVAMREKSPDVLLGDLVDVGSGHFDWHHEIAPVLSMFLRKAVQYRLPESGEKLVPISPTSGVLVDPSTLGTVRYKAVPYMEWRGDRDKALWYFDKEMADTVNRYMRAGLEKKPQAIDFVVNGKPALLTNDGFAVLRPQFLADGVRFRVHAESLSTSPTPHLFGGEMLGHSKSKIEYRVSSGALNQVGPDTFEVAGQSGGLTRQGNPWEPWIMAYKSGDENYRSADRPAHILIDILNKQGDSQSIDFSAPGNVAVGTRKIRLIATASSGLPVQFYVESGPVAVEGDHLRLLPIPARSRFPVRVIVSAFQWGRVGGQPVQSAAPVTHEFFITSKTQNNENDQTR